MREHAGLAEFGSYARFRRLLLCAVLVTSAGCRITPAPDWLWPASRGGIDTETLARVDSICERLVEDEKTPGLVLLVGRGDRVLFRKAYGARMRAPTFEPMTVDTLFDLASLTKPTCTAGAIMLLAQDGRLDANDPVSRYVPEFDNDDKRDITIAQLLTHTSGLPAYVSAPIVEKAQGLRPNPDGLIRHIAGLDKKYETGKGYTYSCLNYLTLARVVQNVSGETMETLLHRRLWRPLGMNDTTFFPDELETPRTAPTIHTSATLRRAEVHDPLAYYSVCADYTPGNAGCFSTADDLSRLVRMLLKEGRWKGRRIFKRDIVEKMTTDQTGALEAERTFGWGITTSKYYSTPLNRTPETACLIHTGYTGNLIWIDKRTKLWVVFLSNAVYPDDNKSRKQAVIEARRDLIHMLFQ